MQARFDNAKQLCHCDAQHERGTCSARYHVADRVRSITLLNLPLTRFAHSASSITVRMDFYRSWVKIGEQERAWWATSTSELLQYSSCS